MTLKTYSNSLLGSMSEEDRSGFLGLGKKLEFKHKACIFLQGDLGTCLYAIESGSVAISTNSNDGKEVILQVLHAGDVFGEVAMFDQLERTTNATAEKETVLLSVDRRDFLNFLDKKPTLYRAIINLLCKRLRWSSKLVESFVFADSMERLVTRLAYLAEYHGHKKNALIEISQDDLAKMLGLSREIVNKNLQELQAQNLLTIERKKIMIPDVDNLVLFNKERA